MESRVQLSKSLFWMRQTVWPRMLRAHSGIKTIYFLILIQDSLTLCIYILYIYIFSKIRGSLNYAQEYYYIFFSLPCLSTLFLSLKANDGEGGQEHQVLSHLQLRQQDHWANHLQMCQVQVSFYCKEILCRFGDHSKSKCKEQWLLNTLCHAE